MAIDRKESMLRFKAFSKRGSLTTCTHIALISYRSQANSQTDISRQSGDIPANSLFSMLYSPYNSPHVHIALTDAYLDYVIRRQLRNKLILAGVNPCSVLRCSRKNDTPLFFSFKFNASKYPNDDLRGDRLTVVFAHTK